MDNSINENKRIAKINFIGGCTFGVLLIHANSDTMRQWLWKDTLNNVSYFNSETLIFHAIASVIIIFAICIVIDRIRIITFERYVFNHIDQFLSKHNLK